MRPKLALPFTILEAPGQVRLVAGEDVRYTLRAENIEGWLPGLLRSLDGRTLDEVLATVPEERRPRARSLLERLMGERVLVEAPARDAHAPRTDLAVLVQDRLDWDEALRWNRARKAEKTPWLWVSSGALARGYVSPVFLPDAGPCLECLIRGFQRLSPFPELYDELIAHAKKGAPIEPVPFPAEGRAILDGLVAWKRAQLALAEPLPALYRLHVLEVDSFAVSTHRVLADPACPVCAR